MPQIETANTVLYCEKWTETAAFYRDVLQLTPLLHNDWFVEFALTDTARISIANAARTTIDSVAGQGFTLTLQVADVESIRQQLLTADIDVGPISQRFDADVCYLHDPEGHRIELWTPHQPL